MARRNFAAASLEVTLLQRGAAFRDVERRALIAIVCRDEIAPFLEFGRGLVLPPRPREGQPELIPGFAALRLEPRGFLEGRNRVGHLAVPKERLAERQVSPGERGRELDDLAQLLDLLRVSGRPAGAIRDRQVELRARGCRRQRDGFLELPDRRFGVGGGQGGAKIGTRLRVVGADAHGLAKRRDPRLVFSGLNQHQAEMVVGFGEIRPETNGVRGIQQPRRGSERRCGRAGGRECCVLPRGVRRRRSSRHVRRPAIAESQSGAGTDGVGTFSPASNCPSALSGFPARRYVMPRSTKTAAVGGSSAIARCRLARAPARSPFSRRAVPRNAWLAPAAGSSVTLCRSSDKALSLEPPYHSATPRL